jgi:hypothetical protein
MTAVSLFDLVERFARDHEPLTSARLGGLAEKLCRSLADDLERLREYEKEFAAAAAADTDDDDAAELEILRSIWRLYDAWAQEAEQVLSRVNRLEAAGQAINAAAQLREGYGRVRARLSVTPEQIVKAKQQVRQGHVVPVKELRDELRARLRA